MKNWVSGMVLTTLLSGCQTVQIPNVTFIGSLGPSGAEEFDLLDTNESSLTLSEFAAQWNDLANPSGPLVCMRTKDFAAIKADLEALCSWVQGGCTQQQKQAMSQFMQNIKGLGGSP